MADLGGQHWLVSPDAEVEKQWLKVQINERISRLKGTRLAIEDLMTVQAEKLKGNIMMIERELVDLEDKLATLNGRVVNAEVSDG